MKRRFVLYLLFSSGLFPTLFASGKTKSKNPYDEKRLLEQNKRMQKENNAPEGFPNFIREGQFHAISDFPSSGNYSITYLNCQFSLNKLSCAKSSNCEDITVAVSLLSHKYLEIGAISIDVCESESGFEVKVVASDNYIKSDSGLIYRDFEVGKGDCPKDGQQVFPLSSLEAIASCSCYDISIRAV